MQAPPVQRNTLRMRSVFISDVHLGFKGCQAGYLLDFLRTVECEQIYLVGDIVDRHVAPSDTSSPAGAVRLLWQERQLSECAKIDKSWWGLRPFFEVCAAPPALGDATNETSQSRQASSRSRRIGIVSPGYFQKSKRPPSNQSHRK